MENEQNKDAIKQEIKIMQARNRIIKLIANETDIGKLKAIEAFITQKRIVFSSFIEWITFCGKPGNIPDDYEVVLKGEMKKILCRESDLSVNDSGELKADN
jgi:hypothetical protein